MHSIPTFFKKLHQCQKNENATPLSKIGLQIISWAISSEIYTYSIVIVQ